MFGFLKKKKKDQEPGPEGASTASTDASTDKETPETQKPVKKKKGRLKLILISVLVLVAVAGSGFAVYLFYFSGSSADDESAKYKKVDLPHLQLPDEILQFSFEQLPELYTAMLDYNKEMNLLDAEIARIEGIGAQYPDQKKIADKEKKSWEKIKVTLEKTFLKIQKPVKETYVLYRVNKEQGRARIEETRTELTQTAQTAVSSVREFTDKLKPTETVPEGFIQGTLYKLKKKFL